MTIHTRIMQLYFVEGTPFWDTPFDPVTQLRYVEATLVCDEQIAVFAFGLLKDEYFFELYSDVMDAIYRMFFAPIETERVDPASGAPAAKVLMGNIEVRRPAADGGSRAGPGAQAATRAGHRGGGALR